jgi:hypothetical protein
MWLFGGDRTGNRTLRKRRSRDGRKTGQNGRSERHPIALSGRYESPGPLRALAPNCATIVERTRNRIIVTAQVLFRRRPSPAFVKGCGRRALEAPGLFLVGLVELLASELPHFSCAQRLLAERMIIIVAHFRSEVVNFIFGGRNYGQNRNEHARDNVTTPSDASISASGIL